jgi:hypothetical protein
MSDTIYTRDHSSGKVHIRTLIGQRYATHESDNLDQAGLFDLLESLDDVDPSDLCKRCFPEEHQDQQAG